LGDRGSREKDLPRFCMRMPVAGSNTPDPNAF
jgi:hypothetical protein